MTPTLATYRWRGRYCTAACACGWEGTGMATLAAAKSEFALHMRDDCPIGARTPDNRR